MVKKKIDNYYDASGQLSKYTSEQEQGLDEPKQGDSEQIKIMKYMARLARQQRDMSVDRSQMSADRSRMSHDRSLMSYDRSIMSEDRSQMSEFRSYLNAERTLSVWVRTALAMMVFGIAIDRFGLLLGHSITKSHAQLNNISFGIGAALVVLSIVMSFSMGLRYLLYSRIWKKRHKLPPYHGPYLATFFSLMVGFFGIALLVIMILFAE